MIRTTFPLVLMSFCLFGVAEEARSEGEGQLVRVGDACAQSSLGGKKWIIGTAAFQQAFEFREGQFRLVRYENRLTSPPTEYIPSQAAAGPFVVSERSDSGGFKVEPVWTKHIPAGGAADPAADGVRVAVKQGDRIGFSLGAHGDYTCDETQWVVTLQYADGETYDSSKDSVLDQGPIWYFYSRLAGTGVLELLDVVEAHSYAKERVRIPAEGDGRRAAGGCPHIGTTKWHPANGLDAVRVWRAPKAGTVEIKGTATSIGGGGGGVDVAILRLEEKLGKAKGDAETDNGWAFEKAGALQVCVGGRPALQLDVTLRCRTLRMQFHVLVYPGTSISRQWLEVENTGSESRIIQAKPASLGLSASDGEPYTHYWMVGGNSKEDQGMLKSATVVGDYHQAIEGKATYGHVPWMALQRKGASADGWFLALEHLSPWRLTVDRQKSGVLAATAGIRELEYFELGPGKVLELPPVTTGVFRGDLDGMGEQLYRWQYEYLWEYTNSDYFARCKWAVPWFYCSRNLQEQFTARLAYLDMLDADLMRSVGFDMLWDDAGWSSYPGWPEDNYGSVFRNTYEGPDFSQTLRYFPKMGMGWLLWFAGRPSEGVMDTKVGSWGNFEWRSDGLDFPSLASDRDWRAKATRFLWAHPRCSFHTCSGGSTYSHTFDMQRLANTNYLADFGRGPQTNHYFSYLEPPDRWVDIIEPWGAKGTYRAETARQLLTMVPMWGLYATEADQESLRRLVEIYHYLLAEGVAGRWSYVFHPKVEGDVEFYYFQRASFDRTKACIILKHRVPGEVTIFPRGLLPGHNYVVGSDSTQETTARTGADLMARGIVIRDQKPGELVYLGLPSRPLGGSDHRVPEAPGRVICRRETNLGYGGAALYWSPGRDDNWISFYEVRRGDRVLGRASTGCYYFDHSPGRDPAAPYAVRTVDGDGNASPWTAATSVAGEPLTYYALGGHFADSGREGWRAETTTDYQAFAPMNWVPPAKTPAGDLGGTPNQPGGVEGYWEGAGTARVGRGWQRSSTDAACVRTWVAPVAGDVRVIGRAMKEWYRQSQGTPLCVCILHGTRQVWPNEGSAMVRPNDLVGATHDFALAVAAGDAVRFVLGRGTTPDQEIIAWMPRIVYGESPAGTRPAPPEGGTGSGAGVVRILCGAEKPFTDHSGNVWSADQYFTGGEAVATTVPIEGAMPAPADQGLYQAGRQGRDFRYAIPVRPGAYALRLKFAESKHEWAFERPFHVEINGRRVLTNFDIVHAASGPRRAHERVFRYLVPDAEGKLVLRFIGGSEPTQTTDKAMVQAIEVLPEFRPVVRIDVGADCPFIDWNSFIWDADAHFEGGRTLSSDAVVSQASPTLYDQALYQTARSGRAFSYALSMPQGLYAVHLKFAELWLTEPGRRPMTIEINGRRVREKWDPAQAAGQMRMSADIRAEDVTPDAQGRITVRISANGPEDAILQGIEIE